MSPVDPRLGGVVYGLTPRDAQIALLQSQITDLQRQVADLRAAATIQIGSGTPSGFTARDGTPYGQTNATFWLHFPIGWRGVTLPLT